MACPSATNVVNRCVMLRHRLEHAVEEFAQYVVVSSLCVCLLNYAASFQEGFWNKAAAIVREISGRQMFNDANKRTAQFVVEELMKRNCIATGVSAAQMRRVIGQVAKGELREIDEIAKAMRGF